MISQDLFFGVLVLFLVFCVTYWFKSRKKLPPGPIGLPVVGYLPFLNPTHPHYSLTKLTHKFGPIYSVQLGSIFTVVVSDVKLVRQALALESFSGRAPLFLTHGIMKGNGIICVQGEKWKEQRKFVVNCLKNFGMIKFGEKRHKMAADIQKGVSFFIQKLQQSEGKPIDYSHMLMHSLGNVVFKLVFGITWEEDDETWKELMNLQEEGTKLIGIAGPINFIPFLRFLPKYKKVINYIEKGIVYSHKIYEKILQNHQNSLNDDRRETENFSHFLGCFEREMHKNKNTQSFYTLPQFNYLMADLWGAGVDTTITTLRWFFFYIAHHTEYQKNIQEELDEVVGDKEINLDDITLLPFLQASVSEVQRIRSVTPLGIPHGTTEDCTLSGYHIPKGTMIVPLQWAIHMNPTHYPNPDIYDPKRFLNDDGSYAKRDAFIPFQCGKRMCLGEEYARMLLFLYAGATLQKFSLLLDGPNPDFEGQVGITLTPKYHQIKFLQRH